ncbi:MAG: polyphenol oxidase family protein, partial [Ignavibacteriaceae bacterium]|nr:polyphenol oxidase family protein [Ignavibacteriaceae bacterium]
MLIVKPFIFKQYPEIVYGFSTKIGPNANPPYYFNLSYSVGDNKEIVDLSRESFFYKLGLNENKISYQKQVHEDYIREVNVSGNCGESDALITTSKNLGLAISSADCPAIFIYDPVKKNIAAVHSGWRGTEKKIVQKTIIKLKDEFSSDPQDLICYIGPS